MSGVEMYYSNPLQAYTLRHFPTRRVGARLSARIHLPNLRLPGVIRGETAINALGGWLVDVARAYGKDPGQLRALQAAEFAFIPY